VKRLGMAALCLAVLGLLVVAGAPDALLEVETRRARACFERIEKAELEDCSAQHLGWLQRVPWTARSAELVNEEIAARMAAMRYLDAAVGTPDAEALTARFADLEDVRRRVQEGSGRLSLDLLGPRIGVPEPDTLAQRAGHRQGLLSGAERWTHHYSRAHALDAALLEGNIERAVELAAAYLDTPSAALRLRAAALLCAGGAPKQGMTVAAKVEQERVDGRKANVINHFGGARVVVEACAGLAGQTAPKILSYGHAGDWDQRARIMALRLRQLACDARPCPPDDEHVEHVRQLLMTKHAGPYRLELLALMAGSVHDLHIERKDLEARIPEVVDDWIARADDAPFVRPERWEHAAEHFEDARLVMRIQAVMGYALRGDLTAADRVLAGVDRHHARLGATAALLAGDTNEARRRIEASPADDPAAQLLRAELYLPDRQAARAAAERALAIAHEQKNARVAAHLRWLLLALGAKVSDAPVPPRVPDLGRQEPRLSLAARERDLDEVLATWQSWLASPSRAVRWRAFQHGGDAPEALAAYVFAAGRLVEGEKGAQIETWLDALLAQDVRRFSLRRYALARWRAASWRADDVAAQRWRRRFLKLLHVAAQPATAELMHASRL
jgi:hypothetical protein